MTAVSQLGYLGFEVSDLDAWEGFAGSILGLGVVDRHDDGFALRLDSHAQRVLVERGEADDLSLIGWQLNDGDAFEAMVQRLLEAGVEVAVASDDLARKRRVGRLASLHDPSGIPTELYCEPEVAEASFCSDLVPGGFVAENHGVGHVVIRADSVANSEAFYCDLLGLRLSDRIQCETYGIAVDLRFYHANGRHHSLAFGAPAPDKRIHHFMLQMQQVDQVGLAYDRVLRARLPVAQTLGRHPNDRMLSFYAHTPSGFQFEVGWGAIEVDDGSWETATYDRISDWGHHPPALIGRRGVKAGPKP